ncbi:hypothetical protein OSB04_001060 [Centaurea solstitialis]|uniref:NPH3 domain-containing protein n=1 Tax=Centaurea solstitialis TaxID=347529 RepID=A0AA38TQL0_9ASTR|nr:hypothetical protein OSB04_001060 [Centaurea solstitialis]
MAAHAKTTNRVSLAMERTGQWVFSQDIPTDVIVQVGEAKFPLHKINTRIERTDMARLDLSSIPGGAEIFEKAAKFCYGVNFEITVHNVAALRCAAEYLDMTDQYCDGNLAGRTDDFLVQVALTSLSGAVVVLKSCEDLLPIAEQINIIQRCVEVASAKACNEANFPSRSPPNWWTDELSIVHIKFFEKIIASMKSRGAKPLTIASAIITYTERALPDLVRDHSGNAVKNSIATDSNTRSQQRELLESIIALLPVENPQRVSFPISFLCCLLRTAIFLENDDVWKKQLEKRISAMLEHVTVDDLLVLSYTFDGETLYDLESVRRIISGFVEKEKSVSVFNGGDFREVSSTAMLRVAKTVDAYLGEIATVAELSISKFNGIANLVPKNARKMDDDLYRAIDIYLKAHPNLDEIEREKVCSAMDPLRLSYEARVHASQNKRLPVQIVLHALYFDQLQIRSGKNEKSTPDALSMRSQVQADVSLAKENEALKSELLQMKAYISDIQHKNQVGSTSARIGNPKKHRFFSSMSKTLGKLNPFRHGSKDTSNIVDDGDEVDHTKPRRRRFSIS